MLRLLKGKIIIKKSDSINFSPEARRAAQNEQQTQLLPKSKEILNNIINYTKKIPSLTTRVSPKILKAIDVFE